MKWMRACIRICCAYICLVSLMSIAACNFTESRTPDQWFEFTWAGLAGLDTLSFKGEAKIVREDEGTWGNIISYSGQLNEHNELTLQTLIPTEVSDEIQVSQLKKKATKPVTAKLLRESGDWVITHYSDQELEQTLTHLNPLAQLDEIQQSKRKVKEEKGAARGTRVLRIEMDPAQSLDSLASSLHAEMNQLDELVDLELTSHDLSSADRNKLKEKLQAVWNRGNLQLEAMLENATVKRVFHLTMNRKSGLPDRLTSETNITFINAKGIKQSEVLVTDNRFDTDQ